MRSVREEESATAKERRVSACVPHQTGEDLLVNKRCVLKTALAMGCVWMESAFAMVIGLELLATSKEVATMTVSTVVLAWRESVNVEHFSEARTVRWTTAK